MYSITKKLFFLITFIFSINTEENVNIWENINSISTIDEEGKEIISYAADGKYGCELFLIKSNQNTYFILKDGIENKIKINYDLAYIKPPLIKNNTNYYFCSSYHKLLYINKNREEYEVKEIENPEDITNQNFSLRCLRGEDFIFVAFLNTKYIYYYDLINEKWMKPSIRFIRNFNLVKFIAVNNYTNPWYAGCYYYTALYSIYKDNKEQYHLSNFKNQNNQLQEEKGIDVENEKIKLYSNVEIVNNENIESRGAITFLFTYTPSTNNFTFYQINLEKVSDFFEAKEYFRYFDEFKINSAGFFENETFLYYSIESLRDKKKYIGVADMKYNLVIFNVKINMNVNVYFNYGPYFNRNSKLIYFSNNRKISYCPFILDENNNCINKAYGSFFYIALNNNQKYINSKISPCSKNVIGNYYCIDDCPIGYIKKNQECIYCVLTENQVYFYKTKKCDSKDNCGKSNEIINGICYDCSSENLDENYFYYKSKCIKKCSDYNALEENGKCVECKEKNKEYYSVYEDICLDKCEKGEIDNYNKTCKKCHLNNQVYFPLLNKCENECESIYYNNSGQCELCPPDKYYEDGVCVEKCKDNYGKDIEKIYQYDENEEVNGEEDIEYCLNCSTKKYYFEEGNCKSICGVGYKMFTKNYTCIPCGENEFYMINFQDCFDKCPEGTKLDGGNKCSFCGDNEFLDLDNNKTCIRECKENQGKIRKNVEELNYSYNGCKSCEKNEILVNKICQKKELCSGRYYKYSEDSCYKCFCGNINEDYHCLDKDNKCKCNLPYYGNNCEFYSIINNKNNPLIINTTNNILIKTDKNYFEYELRNEELSNNCLFIWKVFLNKEEINDDINTKKYFTTSKNEAKFGINKELFEKNKNEIYISLEIMDYEKNKRFYQQIKLINIESFEGTKRGHHHNYGTITPINMETIISLKIENDNNKKIEGKYFYQYRFSDYFNEILPITDYLELEEINIYSVYSKEFYISIKNDREEKILTEKFSNAEYSRISQTIYQIINSEDYTNTEKIFCLISNLLKNEINKDEEIELINKFIINRTSEIINEYGYYKEKSNFFSENNKNSRIPIIYSEPKSIFSLINYFAIGLKKKMNEIYIIDKFLKYFKDIFDENFIIGKITDKTFDKYDIKSLFRTLDNLYNICFEKHLNSMNITNNFIEVLDKLSKYLSFISFPSESIKLIGKRISLISYHFGEHQTIISFPYNNNLGEVDINDFKSYSYDNYYLNENICTLRSNTFFCLTEENYENLKTQLLSHNHSINDLSLNIYLLQDLNKGNENIINNTDKKKEYDDEEDIKINYYSKNYTLTYKIYDNKDKIYQNITLLNNDKIPLSLDIEFPFGNFSNENSKIKIKKNNEKSIGSKLKDYFDNMGWNISLSPNNSEYVCVPKKYYKNRNKSYSCITHFDYNKNSVRCSCISDINDQIIVVKDKNISNIFKHIQFQPSVYNYRNKYSLYIIISFIFLLFIPSIYFTFTDLKIDSKNIDYIEKNIFEDERKKKYNEVKKYCNTGIIKFSFYLTLYNFPLFSIFNKYNYKYPKFIKHLIICIGLFLGIIFPLLIYYFIPFSEKDAFMEQRDINFDDSDIKYIVPPKYYVLSTLFCFLGLIISNIFIFFFMEFMGFQQDEKNFWLKIKLICKEYIYNDVKSQVLLGSTWNKIKLRMLSFYYITNNYILRNKNDKFKEYLKFASRNYKERYSKKDDDLLPYGIKILNDSNIQSISISKDINYNENKNKLKTFEMSEKLESLLDKNEKENIFNDNFINNTNDKKYFRDSIYSKGDKINIKKNYINCQVCNVDNFFLDNNSQDDKAKRKLEKYVLIRNRYIYVSKRKENNEIEIDKISVNSEINRFCICYQINYTYFPSDKFIDIQQSNSEKKESNKNIIIFIRVFILLWILFIILIFFILFLVKFLLDKFDNFILQAWIIPTSIIFTLVYFIFYFIKIVIGAFLIFNFYHIRKENCFVKLLFSIFVDKKSIYIYKVRNLITKYKKEFDYL